MAINKSDIYKYLT